MLKFNIPKITHSIFLSTCYKHLSFPLSLFTSDFTRSLSRIRSQHLTPHVALFSTSSVCQPLASSPTACGESVVNCSRQSRTKLDSHSFGLPSWYHQSQHLHCLNLGSNSTNLAFSASYYSKTTQSHHLWKRVPWLGSYNRRHLWISDLQFDGTISAKLCCVVRSRSLALNLQQNYPYFVHFSPSKNFVHFF